MKNFLVFLLVLVLIIIVVVLVKKPSGKNTETNETSNMMIDGTNPEDMNGDMIGGNASVEFGGEGDTLAQ